ncbi:DNA polymerase delta subunit 4 [Cladobotryum mycophilum]|uniref:DNA polymerase delta subunit 4 n=1 Tax=Cladobotryum mycophilum TaxID=491253 RepID=A0ABR0SZA3_9HYPO
MPTTRRSAANARGRTGPAKGQATISFSNKVTKSVPKENDLKKVVDSPAVVKSEIPERLASATKEEPAREETAEVAVEAPETIEEPEVETKEKFTEKPEAEIKAEKITDAQIGSYWKAIEKKRIAPRVHQEDLDVHEKVLRYFDVSSHYGPCIGMTRLKRWQRAERLGLNPPIEVLAVLLKEDSKGHRDIQTAQMDRIMNAAAVLA